MLDIRELIPRVQWARPIGRSLGTAGQSKDGQQISDVGAAAGPREWPAARPRVVAGAPDDDAAGEFTAAGPSKVVPFRDQVIALRQRGVECRAIFDILREQDAFAGSYGSVYRFVRHVEPRTPDACVRVERDPGDEAQVDFGYAGLVQDPASETLRKRRRSS